MIRVLRRWIKYKWLRLFRSVKIIKMVFNHANNVALIFMDGDNLVKRIS